jgi:plasmid stabilization system protein ParE
VTPIIWSPQAIDDVLGIQTYIRADSERYADLVVRRIVSSVEQLSLFPQSGRIVPERRDPEIREVILRPYRVVYRHRGSVVEIVTVFRGTREFPVDVK